MPENPGYEIRINAVPRTHRDVKTVGFDAARFMKDRHPRDLIESVDLATGEKVLMLPDGRTG
jgi:hypothetical protein